MSDEIDFAPLAAVLGLVACVHTSVSAVEPAEMPAGSEPVRVSAPAHTSEPKPVASEVPLELAPLHRFEGPAIAEELRDGGLKVVDFAPGEGPAAELGDYVEVHYMLTLADGVVIDSSHERGPPLALVLGETGMIPGFTAGLVGARPGMLRTLIIPPQLGYGERPLAGIPPNSTLNFHVQVMTVRSF